MLRSWLLSIIAWGVYKTLVSSWRIHFIESQDLKSAREKGGRPIIFAHWHGDELGLVHLVKKYKIATMTSTSKDGQLMEFVIRRLGGQTSRGSSTRGAVSALKGLVRLCRSGYNASMAVDGPRGPRHKVKPGAFELARLTDAIIIPTAIFAERPFVFQKSWNKAILPMPFSRVHIAFGPALAFDEQTSVKSPELAAQLKAAIFATYALAQR